MDIIAAYREVGSYRGAAAICGTTHKTVKRMIEPPRGRRRGRRGGRRGPATTTRSPSWSRSGWQKTTGRISAKRLLPAARAAGYEGSARNFRRLVAEAKRVVAPRPSVGAVGRRCGRPGETLVIDWGVAGRAARVLRGAGLVAGPVRALRRRREGRHDAGAARGVLRGPRRGPGGGARRPDGLPEGRGGRERGGADPGLRAVRRPLRVPARLLRGRRPGVEGDRGEPGRLRQDRPDGPAAPTGPASRSPTWRRRTTAAAAWCVEVNAAVHSEICAVPAERLAIERELLGRVAVAAPAVRPKPIDPQGRPSCRVSGSARRRYSVPGRADRHAGAVLVDDRTARCGSSSRSPGRSSPSTRWSPRVRRRSSMTTTAARGRTRRGGRCGREPRRRRRSARSARSRRRS